jgi:hypothetical protein
MPAVVATPAKDSLTPLVSEIAANIDATTIVLITRICFSLIPRKDVPTPAAAPSPAPHPRTMMRCMRLFQGQPECRINSTSAIKNARNFV